MCVIHNPLPVIFPFLPCSSRFHQIPLPASNYKNLIHLLARAGQWRPALDVLLRMRSQGLPLDTIALCSAMNACRRAGRREAVLTLLQIMKERGLPPSPVAYHTAMHTLGGLPMTRRRSNQSRAFSGGGDEVIGRGPTATEGKRARAPPPGPVAVKDVGKDRSGSGSVGGRSRKKGA